MYYLGFFRNIQNLFVTKCLSKLEVNKENVNHAEVSKDSPVKRVTPEIKEYLLSLGFTTEPDEILFKKDQQQRQFHLYASTKGISKMQLVWLIPNAPVRIETLFAGYRIVELEDVKKFVGGNIYFT